MFFTERLTVDLVASKDAGQIFSYYKRNVQHLRQWEPARVKGHHSMEAWRARADEQARNNATGSSYHFVMRLVGNEEIVGVCNFNNVSRGAFPACYLGHSVDGEREGQGLMYEALSAAIPFVFESFGLHRIMANYMPKNERSGKLLQRL